MICSVKALNPEFRSGDEVVLTDGAYEGTPGIFLQLRQDPNWADIREWNGVIRSHPVVWLKLGSSPLVQGQR